VYGVRNERVSDVLRIEDGLKRPYLDFYRSLDISPVHQDISDLARHYRRRESLYRFLGIPRSAVRGADVIEFGPGSGLNALYTASLRPASYTLVDANGRGIADMRALFAQHDVVEGIAIVESLVEELPVTSSYDLVLAEGLIVIQTDPAAFAQRIAQFAKPGGIVVLTCSDAVSVFAEAGRRLIAGRVAPADMDLDRRMSILRSLFTPHLTTLAAMSRPIDDWILDNIIQPFGDGKLFSMSDAIEGLEADFDVYGSSPRFLTDWRWYKEVANVERGFNELARRNYGESVLNLLDHRFVHERQPAAFGQALLAHCQVFYELMLQLETGSDVWREINVCLVEIADVVLPVAPETCESIQSLREFLFAARPDTCQLEAFAPFFGRGLQYMSFVRRAEDGDTCLVH